MPKQKTRRSAAKRFRLTGTGKIRRNKANHSHMLIRRGKSAKRKMRQPDLVDGSEEKARPSDDCSINRSIICLEQIVLCHGTDDIAK